MLSSSCRDRACCPRSRWNCSSGRPARSTAPWCHTGSSRRARRRGRRSTWRRRKESGTMRSLAAVQPSASEPPEGESVGISVPRHPHDQGRCDTCAARRGCCKHRWVCRKSCERQSLVLGRWKRFVLRLKLRAFWAHLGHLLRTIRRDEPAARPRGRGARQHR